MQGMFPPIPGLVSCAGVRRLLTFPVFLRSCETKSGTESLGLRLKIGGTAVFLTIRYAVYLQKPIIPFSTTQSKPSLHSKVSLEPVLMHVYILMSTTLIFLISAQLCTMS